MKIDSAGMLVPEPEPVHRGPEWFCLMCHKPTWPTVTADGDVIARCCVGCQAVVDLAAAEHARTKRPA